MEEPPVEPDLLLPWRMNVWLYGMRPYFSLVFLGWVTFAQMIAPNFNAQIFGLTILVSFLGLVIGAHYVDIATSTKKFSPFFRIPTSQMLAVGILAILAAVAVGLYMAVRWNVFFIAFVAIEGFAAFAYPRESPKFAHNYLSFGLTWGVVPFLAAYFIQSGSLTFLAVGISIFVGLSVVMMHHLAMMSRESPGWRDALYLLKLYRYSVYSIALFAIISKLVTI
jgi:hypothetical protein